MSSTLTVRGVPIEPDLSRTLNRASARALLWHERRNALIRQAYAEGGSLREIARLTGLSHVGVLGIVRAMAPDTEETEE